MESCPFCTFEAEVLGERCPACGNEVRSDVLASVAVAAGDPTPGTGYDVGDGADDAPDGRGGGFRRFRTWGTIAFVAFVAASGLYGFVTAAGRDAETGEVTKAGQVAADDFRVGDCLELPEEMGDEFDAMKAVPCAEPHDLEIFHQFALADRPYPSDEEFGRLIIEACDPVFETYVGSPYEDSVLDYDWFFPVESAWEAGERTVECVLFDLEGAQLAGTMRGSGR